MNVHYIDNVRVYYAGGGAANKTNRKKMFCIHFYPGKIIFKGWMLPIATGTA
jgi:hypothetical protein